MNPDIIIEGDKRFVMLHGIKIEIREDCSGCDASVHSLVSDGPALARGAWIIKCHQCQQDIWMSPGTPESIPHYCMDCAATLLDQHHHAE